MKKKNTWFWVAIVVVVVGLFGAVAWKRAQPGQYDTLASCLTERGAKFYGAYWCPHCKTQKEMFGRSERLLPYIECAAPNSNTQSRACAEKKIDVYPTWDFADGSRETGTLSFERLAEKTGCPLP